MSEYWTVEDVVARVRCGPKVIYRAVHAGKLRAARISDRGDFRFKPEWADAWLEASASPIPVVPKRRDYGGRGSSVFISLSIEGLAVSTRSQYVQVIKSVFRWPKRKGHIHRNPISEESTIKRGRVTQRRRRILADGEDRLLRPLVLPREAWPCGSNRSSSRRSRPGVAEGNCSRSDERTSTSRSAGCL